jgi:hypothetical protein
VSSTSSMFEPSLSIPLTLSIAFFSLPDAILHSHSHGLHETGVGGEWVAWCAELSIIFVFHVEAISIDTSNALNSILLSTWRHSSFSFSWASWNRWRGKGQPGVPS